MSHLRNSILATVAYYNIFDVALTLFEIHKFLVNPARLVRTAVSGTITLGQLSEEVDGLVKSGFLATKNGFYFLPGRQDLYGLRIEKEKILSEKWKKLLKTAFWFQAVPFLKGIFASGSMAMGNTDSNSDFDVLVVASDRRLYTCRLFLSLTASFFNVRRKRFDKIAPDKFCFNHYITDKSLNIVHESIFNAHTYIHLKPVIMPPGLFNDFYASNLWLNKYAYNFKPSGQFVRRSVKPNIVLRSTATLLEFSLNNRFGDWLENILKKYQQWRIRTNPVTYEKKGRIVFNERELEFHPRSFENIVIKKYNLSLRSLGIMPPEEEKDSGLN